MSFEEAVDVVKLVVIGFVLLLLLISVLPPLIMYVFTGDLDYWIDAFVGAVVPWWVGLPGVLIVVVILAFAALDLEELL